jgi:peptide/nickel transport system substrate-binding protein
MKGKYLIAGILVLVLLIGSSIGVFGQELYSIPAAATNVKYGGTVRYVSPQGTLPPSFNPFLSYTSPSVGLIYEPLFYVNIYNGHMTPMLGTSYKFTDDDLELLISTREDAKWSDGVPFTAKDVAFTFNYLKENPALDTAGQWLPITYLQSVEASGDNTVIFKFSKPDIPDFQLRIAEQVIVPEHIWSKIDKPLQFVNDNPIGTGPFLYKSISTANNSVEYIRNPNYWMKGRPYIDKFIYTSVPSNTTGLQMLIKNEADWGWIGLTVEPQQLFSQNPYLKDSWFPAIADDVLLLNTQKPPLNNPIFRKAISLAMNREVMEKAFYGNLTQVANALAIPPSQNEWIDPTLQTWAASLCSYNPAESLKLLESIGYHKDTAGILVGPDGKEIRPLILTTVAGWTNYVGDLQVLSDNLKAVGIPTNLELQQTSGWYNGLLTGNYDISILWTSASFNPFWFYYQMLYPAFSAPEGEQVISDYARYTNPIITAALDIYSSTTDTRLQKQCLYVIERIFLDDMPIISVVGSPAWIEYSTQNFIGWPSASNPYDSDPLGVGMEPILLEVHLK